MAYGIKTGGRTKGTPNKITTEVKNKLVELIDGLVLLGEVTSRSMDYLISFGERLSVKLISAALNDLSKKSIPMTGKAVGIVTD